MSKLYATESGGVVSTLCEELTTFRRAQKVLHLPLTSRPASVYVLARPYEGCRRPLQVAVNGTEIRAVEPSRLEPTRYRWYTFSVGPRLMRRGENRFELWADTTAMNAWSLAMEPGHAQPGSFISDDGGITWRNRRMGYLNAVRGEYVVRIRLADGEDPPPPEMIWEDPDHPRLEHLRKIMPREAVETGPALKRIKALSSWISASWEHTNSRRAAQYAPWDPETILAWGAIQSGHDGRRPIVMCVHYAVVFVSCCAAIGLPARCTVLKTGLPGGSGGHFVAEVWLEAYDKWVMVDPTWDLMVWKDSLPLSVTEIQEVDTSLDGLFDLGPGFEMQCRQRGIDRLPSHFMDGALYTHRSIWPRADFLSHPESSPPGHGAIAYCETDLVWQRRDLENGYGMFSYFADPTYFDRSPVLDR